MEKNYKIALILRIPERNLSHSTLYIEKSLEMVRKLKPGIKINWNIPQSPLCEDPRERSIQIASELQARFYFTDDCLIPMGFTGAKHPLLCFEDFKKEIHWTFSSPGKNIFASCLKNKIKVIMPYCFDFLKNEFMEFYNNGDNIWLADSEDKPGLGTFSILFNNKILSKPLIYLNDLKKKELPKFLNHHLNKENNIVFALIDLKHNNNVKDLQVFSQELEKFLEKKRNYNLDFINIYDYLKDEADSINNEVSDDFYISYNKIRIKRSPFSPMERFSRIHAFDQYIYDRFESNSIFSNIKKRLYLNSHTSRKDTIENRSQAPVVRTLVSSITGLSSLPDSRFHAFFDEGRLSALEIEENYKMICGTVSSFINNEYFSQVSSFTFESEKARGLREILEINSKNFKKPGKQLVDYFFIDGTYNFFVSISTLYPVIKKNTVINKYAPFEIPLFCFNEKDEISIHIIDNENREIPIHMDIFKSGISFLSGDKFCFEKNQKKIYLNITRNKNDQINLLLYKIVKQDKEYKLILNPGGNYCCTETENMNGIEEHFSLIFSLEPVNNLYFTDIIKDELKENWTSIPG